MEKIREQLYVADEKVILVGAILKGKENESDNLRELTSLTKTAGAIIVDWFQQKIREINPATYIGKGKAERLAERVQSCQATTVIFDNDLSPGQIRALEAIVECQVLDRSELILDIFATRARTKQAKLQVELAQLEYTYPRLTRMWSHLDTVTGGAASGGVGTRGTGEKQLEIDRRLVNKRITDLKRELELIDKRKNREIESRSDQFKICIVGYTNAGKSTLMNQLTEAGVYVQNQLFATLDTRTKRWKLEGAGEVLLSDTVGFVRRLPHQLVESFKATLAEAINADLLLHIVDSSSEEVYEQIDSVNSVLKEIGCEEKDTLIVLNKVDAIDKMQQIEGLQAIYTEAICTSATTGLNIDKLRDAVIKKFKGGSLKVKVTTHLSNGKLQNYLRASSVIVKEHYENDTAEITIKIGKNQLVNIRKLHPDNLEVLS